jgi:transmembrane sensor
MSNVHSFTSKDAIREEACLWVSRIDRGLTPEEKSEIRQWASISSTHAIELKLAAEFWDETSVLQELSSLFPIQFTENDDKNNYWVPAFAVACSAVFIALILTFLPIKTDNQELVENKKSHSQNTYATSVGENRSFRLPDGSVAHLNTDSELSIDYTPEVRRLSLLRGEVHFDVSHDATRPFSVEADTLSVTAIGTAFNIELGKGDIQLLVTDGKVLVTEQHVELSGNDVALLRSDTNEADNLIMSSGEKALLTVNNVKKADIQTERMTLADVQKELAWQQGMLVFQGEPLATVLQEIKRYNDINFDLSDESLGNIQVAGYFKAGDIEGLISTLESNFAIQHVRTEPKRITLSSIAEL